MKEEMRLLLEQLNSIENTNIKEKLDKVIEESEKLGKEQIKRERKNIEKSVKKMLDTSSNIIIASNKGVVVSGSQPEIITTYALLTKRLIEDIPVELLKSVFDYIELEEENE